MSLGATVARRNLVRILLPILALFAIGVSVAPRAGHAAQADVLILRSSVGVPNALNGASFAPEVSPEVMAVTAMGLTYDLVSDTTWAAMTQAQFAAYKAIVIGDAGCAPAFSDAPFGANGTPPDPNFSFYFGYPGTGVLTSTANVWGPITTGNTIVIGTDPSTHVYQPNGNNQNIYDGTTPSMWTTSGGKMIYGGIKFATDQTGYGTTLHTGLYAALGCRYEGFPDTMLQTNSTTDPGWPLYQSQVVANSSRGVYASVPWLAGIHDGASITVDGTAGWAQGGYNVAELVADHPAFNANQPSSPMSNDDVTGWGTSVHAAIRTWAPYDPVNDPRGWIVLAMATDFGREYTANNGHLGTPYIIVRGNGIVPRTDLTVPGACTGSNCVAPRAELGKPYTITVQDSAVCPAGSVPASIPQYVTFTVTGPNGPLTSPKVLVVNGVANWSYTGVNPGTDTIVASNVDCTGAIQKTPPTPVTWFVAGTHRAQLITMEQNGTQGLIVTANDYSDRKNLKTRLYDTQNCTNNDPLSCAGLAGQQISFLWDRLPITDMICTKADFVTPAGPPSAPPCTTDDQGWVYYSINHTPGPSNALTGQRDHRLDLSFAGTSTQLPALQSIPYTVTLDPTATAITSLPTSPLQGNSGWSVTSRTVDDCSPFDDSVTCAAGVHRPVFSRAILFTITGGALTAPYTLYGTTDAGGYATVNVPLPAGVYQVTASFAGDNFYKASQAAAPTTVIAYRPTCFSIWGGDTDRTKLDSLNQIINQATLADTQANSGNKAWYQFWGNMWVQGGQNLDGLTHPGVVGYPVSLSTTNSSYQAYADFKGCVVSTGHQGGDPQLAWGLAGMPAWITDPGTSSFAVPSVDAYIGVIVACTAARGQAYNLGSNHDDVGDVCGLVVLHVEDYARLGNGILAAAGTMVDISGGGLHSDAGHPGFGQVVAVIAHN